MTCKSGKVRYRSGFEAQLALSRCKRRQRQRHGQTRRAESRFYRCPFCFGWHLTSATPFSRRRK